jgi:RNA recognition motif-containing protein
MSTKLYVGNISFTTSNQDLIDLFSGSGKVESVNIIEDRETGRSRGFGFVEMSSSSEAEAAISALNGKEVGGRELKVNEAKPQENRNGGGGGGRRGGGGRQGGGGGYGGSRW